MSGNDIVTGVIAVIIAYLLGSIPSAYIVTRIRSGKDIRKLGGGNVGARNVFVEVGKTAGIAAGIVDVGKGAAAVAIAYRLLNVPFYEPQLFVLLAGIAAICGHIWSIYLRFTGGNGLATTIGVLSVVMVKELGIALAMTLILISFTRNPVLSVNISLLSVPVSGWFLEKSWLFLAFSVLVLLILVLHFLPVARADLARAGSAKSLSDELLRRKKSEAKEN